MISKDIIRISALKKINVTIDIPKDKSITHRAFILGAMSRGVSKVYNPVLSLDILTTINALQGLGVIIDRVGNDFFINGIKTLKNNTCASSLINANNSATTARLLMGLIASNNGMATKIIGDQSLSNRPMDRVVDPLTLMGADIEYCGNFGKLPILIKGKQLNGLEYSLPINSAQLKSSLLIAGLKANSSTKLIGKIKSRNHTELMLKAMNADLVLNYDSIVLKPSILKPFDFNIPSDPSSAVFFWVLASILMDSEVKTRAICINPTRVGVFDVFNQVGINYNCNNIVSDIESIADVTVISSDNKAPFIINPSIVPYLIDEIPILCVLACFCNGRSIIKGIEELRVKECDRVQSMVDNLSKMGADIVADNNSITINGTGYLKGGAVVDSYCDHRIAMSMAIAGLASRNGVTINGYNVASISYNEFFTTIKSLF